MRLAITTVCKCTHSTLYHIFILFSSFSSSFSSSSSFSFSSSSSQVLYAVTWRKELVSQRMASYVTCLTYYYSEWATCNSTCTYWSYKVVKSHSSFAFTFLLSEDLAVLCISSIYIYFSIYLSHMSFLGVPYAQLFHIIYLMIHAYKSLTTLM